MKSLLCLSLTAAVLAVSAPFVAQAAPPIVITGARIRVPPPGAPTAAGYATITNTSDKPDRLMGGSTPAAAGLEVHEMSMTGMVMRMRPVMGGLAIGAHQTVKLGEGGYHLMLIAPKRSLKAGERVSAILRFKTAGAIPVTFTVGR